MPAKVETILTGDPGPIIDALNIAKTALRSYGADVKGINSEIIESNGQMAKSYGLIGKAADTSFSIIAFAAKAVAFHMLGLAGTILGVVSAMAIMLKMANSFDKTQDIIVRSLRDISGSAADSKESFRLLGQSFIASGISIFREAPKMTAEILSLRGAFETVSKGAFILSEQLSLAFGSSPVEEAKKLTKALRSPVDAFETYEALGIRINRNLQQQIIKLQEAGRLEEARLAFMFEISRQTEEQADRNRDNVGTIFANLTSFFLDMAQGAGIMLGNMANAITRFWAPVLRIMFPFGKGLPELTGQFKIRGALTDIDQASKFESKIAGTEDLTDKDLIKERGELRKLNKQRISAETQTRDARMMRFEDETDESQALRIKSNERVAVALKKEEEERVGKFRTAAAISLSKEPLEAIKSGFFGLLDAGKDIGGILLGSIEDVSGAIGVSVKDALVKGAIGAGIEQDRIAFRNAGRLEKEEAELEERTKGLAANIKELRERRQQMPTQIESLQGLFARIQTSSAAGDNPLLDETKKLRLSNEEIAISVAELPTASDISEALIGAIPDRSGFA